jgi:hypothetical protein
MNNKFIVKMTTIGERTSIFEMWHTRKKRYNLDIMSVKIHGQISTKIEQNCRSWPFLTDICHSANKHPLCLGRGLLPLINQFIMIILRWTTYLTVKQLELILSLAEFLFHLHEHLEQETYVMWTHIKVFWRAQVLQPLASSLIILVHTLKVLFKRLYSLFKRV